MMYQAQKVLIQDGRTDELLKLLDRSDAAMKAGPDLYHAALGWCQAEGKEDMATAVMKHASEKFPDDVVSCYIAVGSHIGPKYSLFQLVLYLAAWW